MTVIDKKVNVFIGVKVLDDDHEMNETLKEMFEMHRMTNVHVYFYTDSDNFLKRFDENIHLAIIDHELKGSPLNGVQVMTILRGQYPKCQIIFCSGTDDPKVLKTVMKKIRPEGYVDKDEPNYLDELVSEAERLLVEIRKNFEFAWALEKIKPYER